MHTHSFLPKGNWISQITMHHILSILATKPQRLYTQFKKERKKKKVQESLSRSTQSPLLQRKETINIKFGLVHSAIRARR